MPLQTQARRSEVGERGRFAGELLRLGVRRAGNDQGKECQAAETEDRIE